MTHTMRNLGLGAGAVLIALGTVAAVHASPQNTNPPPRPFMGRMGRMGGPGGGPLGRWGMLASRLGLSDTQRSQIKGILQAHGDELRGLGDKAMAAREALNDAIDSGTVDEAAIRARSAEVAAVEADMAVTRAQIEAQVFQVLTPDQQAQARTLQAQRKERMERMRQRMQQRHEKKSGGL